MWATRTRIRMVSTVSRLLDGEATASLCKRLLPLALSTAMIGQTQSGSLNFRDGDVRFQAPFALSARACS